MADEVLIVDDDVRLSGMLRDYLVQNGFAARTAATATAGLAELARRPPAIVVARRDAARSRRVRVPAPHPRLVRRAGRDAHRQGRRARPHRRPRDRRGRTTCPSPSTRASCLARLKAVLRRRNGGMGAAAGPAPPAASAGSRSTAARGWCASTGSSAHSPPTSSTSSWRWPRTPGACSLRGPADGPRARLRARGLRPLDRRPRLAHPRVDRGRPEASAPDQSPCAGAGYVFARVQTRAGDGAPESASPRGRPCSGRSISPSSPRWCSWPSPSRSCSGSRAPTRPAPGPSAGRTFFSRAPAGREPRPRRSSGSPTRSAADLACAGRDGRLDRGRSAALARAARLRLHAPRRPRRLRPFFLRPGRPCGRGRRRRPQPADPDHHHLRC